MRTSRSASTFWTVLLAHVRSHLLDLPLSKKMRVCSASRWRSALKSGNFGVLFGGAGFNLLLLLGHKRLLVARFPACAQARRGSFRAPPLPHPVPLHYVHDGGVRFPASVRQTFGIKGIVWIEMLSLDVWLRIG